MFLKQKINKGQKYELNRYTNKIWFIFVWRSCTRFFNRGARVAQWVRSLDLTAHTSPSPIRCGFAPSFVNYKKGCTRLAASRDKVYQLLAQDRWFSPGTPVSSTTKTGRHDIAEILLKVALKHKKKPINRSSTDSRHSYGCQLYFSSCRLIPLFVNYPFKASGWSCSSLKMPS